MAIEAAPSLAAAAARCGTWVRQRLHAIAAPRRPQPREAALASSSAALISRLGNKLRALAARSREMPARPLRIVGPLETQTPARPAIPVRPRAAQRRSIGFFHGVADEHQRLHLCTLRLGTGMSEDLADLRVWPPRQSIFSISPPSRVASDTQPDARHSGKPAIVDQLNVEPADCGRLAEHVALPAGRRCPKAAGGSWWRRAQKSAGRGPVCTAGFLAFTSLRKASISVRDDERNRSLAGGFR